MATSFKTDLVMAPGELLAEELEARGLTQTALAEQMGRPIQVVNQIIQGKKTITAQTALQLEKALGIPAELWINLEGTYRLGKARAKAMVG